MRFDTHGVLYGQQFVDVGLRIVHIAENECAVSAGRNARRVFTLREAALEAEVAVFRNFCFLINESHVVGASCDAVLAADALVGVHRDDSRGRIAVRGACRANLDARGVLALLAGYADILALSGRGIKRRLTLKRHAKLPCRNVVRFAAGTLAQTAADAFVLVKDHHVVGAGPIFFLVPCAASGKTEHSQRSDPGSCEELSSVNLYAHVVLLNKSKLVFI